MGAAATVARMELSYTQNLEDYHLSLAFAGQETGFYIDVGAGHPVADNVSFWFYERGWRGIVVEPQSKLARLYERVRPRDITVCALIGREAGESEFFQVERLHGLSTTVRSYAEAAKELGARYRTLRMPMMTLADLCDRQGVGHIDFLKIDVEGAEADVLAGNDWQRFRPAVVIAEAVTPGSGLPGWTEWEPLLLTEGYRFVLDDTLNRFYVAEEHPDILARFPRERAPWGSARHMYEIGRAPENPSHPDHELAMDLARGFWASLPLLDRSLVVSLLARGRQGKAGGEIQALEALANTDAFRAALGRIACGYGARSSRID